MSMTLVARVEDGSESGGDELELSVVMPCLNEARTVGLCIEKALRAMREGNVRGEVVIADNGSTDGSQQIARDLGARVVDVPRKGYGHALRAGIQAARGRYVIMGDSDDSYDFSALAPFVERLRDGYDLVMGNRFRGGIRPGAMPWLHRYVGNPVLTGILNVLYRSPIGDAHCGLRGFRKDSCDRLGLSATGMEFASEMVVRASVSRQRIAEVPIVLHPDGRDRPPHLRSFRDGWRHLRYLLLCAPTFLFVIPGLILTLLGLAAIPITLAAGFGVSTGYFGPNFLYTSSMIAVSGFHLLVFGLLGKYYAHLVDPVFQDPGVERWASFFSVERGLTTGVSLIALAVTLGAPVVGHWLQYGTVPIPGQWIFAGTLFSLGVEAAAGAFLVGILDMSRSAAPGEGGPHVVRRPQRDEVSPSAEKVA
ncbi:glycosyltransferase family 2 protein [Paludisphaera borealis]|uniref:glycosyltransferase family 2 protein n=1 Tax=Paludisphaera borealis TaxID=1387353 RepID=UPI000970F271|nr:glycosyltransferase family 2 protein [Paludisphaera borealis]